MVKKKKKGDHRPAGKPSKGHGRSHLIIHFLASAFGSQLATHTQPLLGPSTLQNHAQSCTRYYLCGPRVTFCSLNTGYPTQKAPKASRFPRAACSRAPYSIFRPLAMRRAGSLCPLSSIQGISDRLPCDRSAGNINSSCNVAGPPFPQSFFGYLARTRFCASARCPPTDSVGTRSLSCGRCHHS